MANTMCHTTCNLNNIAFIYWKNLILTLDYLTSNAYRITSLT